MTISFSSIYWCSTAQVNAYVPGLAVTVTLSGPSNASSAMKVSESGRLISDSVLPANALVRISFTWSDSTTLPMELSP